MGTKKVEIYLGKGGQTYGTFSIEQFESVKKTPDFRTYTYIWDGRDTAPEWKPLELPPEMPVAPKQGPGAPPPDSKHSASTRVAFS